MILHRGKIVADDSIEHLRNLMAVPTLEGIFQQLAVEQDTGAISREIADLIQAWPMNTRLQFRVLYRQFLFRVFDLEVLSADAQGDANKLFGQFAALLVFVSVWSVARERSCSSDPNATRQRDPTALGWCSR